MCRTPSFKNFDFDDIQIVIFFAVHFLFFIIINLFIFGVSLCSLCIFAVQEPLGESWLPEVSPCIFCICWCARKTVFLQLVNTVNLTEF